MNGMVPQAASWVISGLASWGKYCQRMEHNPFSLPEHTAQLHFLVSFEIRFGQMVEFWLVKCERQ
jgi:hypothetical protein